MLSILWGNMATEQQPQNPRPIYEEIKPYALVSITPEEWDADRQLRLQRFEKIVARLATKDINQVPEEAKDFLWEKLTAIRNICSLPAETLIAMESKNRLDCTLLDVFGKNDYWYSMQDPSELLPHTEATLLAADTLLKALTPEMGLQIIDDYRKIREKANHLALRQLSGSYFGHAWIEFATVIPGVNVLYFFPEFPRKTQKSVSVTSGLKRHNTTNPVF